MSGGRNERPNALRRLNKWLRQGWSLPDYVRRRIEARLVLGGARQLSLFELVLEAQERPMKLLGERRYTLADCLLIGAEEQEPWSDQWTLRQVNAYLRSLRNDPHYPRALVATGWVLALGVVLPPIGDAVPAIGGLTYLVPLAAIFVAGRHLWKSLQLQLQFGFDL